MKARISSSRMFVFATLLILALGLASFPAGAAPTSPSAVILSDIDGLDENADTDFWVVDYYDTNGRGDANDPIASLATPPVRLTGYGSTALRVEPNDGAGGSGCARLGGKVFFGTQALNGHKLSDLTEFGYSFLVDQTNGSPAAANLTVYVNLFVDKNGDGSWSGANDSILVYEPLYTSGQPALDTWVANPAIGASETGRWHVVVQPIDGITSDSPSSTTNDNWSEIIALPATGAGIDPAATTIGDLKVLNPPAGCAGSTQGGTGTEGTGSGLALVVGQKSGADWNDFVGYIDGVYLTVTSLTSVHHNLNVIGDPVSATILSGATQTTPVNTGFAPLGVELRDVNNALADLDAQVTVTVPNSGASATFTASSAMVTDATGTVTFYPTANNEVGGYSVDVAAVVGSANVSTTFTNSAAPTLSTVQVFAEDVNGLAGDNTDFWTTEVYDTNPSTDNPAGSIDRTVNASTGYASFEFTVGGQEGVIGTNPAGCTGAGGKVFFGTNKLAGLSLRDLDQLGYATLLKSVGAEDITETLHVYVNLFIDYNNDGLWKPGDDGALVYDTSRPGNLTPPFTLGQWYELADLTSSASSSSWYFSIRSPFNGNLGFNQVDATVNTFQELLAYSDFKPEILGGERLADLKIVNPFAGCIGNTGDSPATEGTSTGVVFVFGQKNGGGYSNMVAHLDSIRLSTSGGGAFDIANLYDVTDYGAATTITATSGGGQSADINAAFTSPLVATVTDAAGRTVPNASVTFTAPNSGASTSLGTASGLTDLFTGQFSTTATANAIAGAYSVSVNTSPTLTAASFSLTNLALAPTAPTDLTATPALDAAEIDLAWTSTANGNQGDQQAIQRSPAGANTWSTLTILGAAAASYTDTDAACSDSFDYRIRVFNGTGEAFSNVATATVPSCPVDIAVSAGDTQSATINTAYTNQLVAVVMDSDGQPAEDVLVNFVAPASGASVTFTSGSSAITDVNGLASVSVSANGTPGTVVVVAITSEIAGDAAFFTLNNTPAAPTAVTTLAATPTSATSVNLTWTSTSTSSFDTYTVYRASDGATFNAIATLAAGATSYNDSGLVCHVTYTYRVDITNVAGTATGSTAGALTNACGELLTNGNFNADAGNTAARTPSGWTGKNISASNRQKCADDGKSVDGPCYLFFKGSTAAKGRFSQVIDVTSLVAGQTLTLTANANAQKGAKGTVELVVTYPNPLRAAKPIVMKYPLKWDTNTTGYTVQTISHTLVSTPTKVMVVIRSRAAKGSWLVDGVSLSLTNIGALRLP